MKCLKCGNEISNNYSVCPHCGASKAENTDAVNGGTGAFVNQGDTYANQYGDLSAMNSSSSSSSFCVMCGRSIPAGYKMCPGCTETRGGAGVKPASSKNTGPIVVAIVAAVITLLCSALFVYAWTTGVFDKDPEPTQVVEEQQNKESDVDMNAEKEAAAKAAAEKAAAEKAAAEKAAAAKAAAEAAKPKYVAYNPGYAITWSGAVSAAAQKGGQLACPNSWEEFEQIKQAANAAGLTKIWLGAKKTGDSWASVYTTDGSGSVYTNWLSGEPSYYDKDKWNNSSVMVDEYCLMALKKNGVWYMNDVANDISYAYKNIGYVVEK